MTDRVAVVGANGRVGRAICDYLATTYAIVPIVRMEGEGPEAIADRSTVDVDLVINAAGVAHLQSVTDADLELLRIGNVELPLALARRCLEQGIGLLHVSSVKAEDGSDPSPYAASKREGDERLQGQCSGAFASIGRSLVVVRPPALLIPPFDAGKLARLRWLRHWPATLTPPVPMPVLTQRTFVGAVLDSIELALRANAQAGFRVRAFDRSERGTLRDVRDAMLRAVEPRT